MPTATYSMTILGCRVNHAEAREMESILIQRGLRAAPPGTTPDLHIIHTCSVTTSAMRKSRHAIRRARKGSSVDFHRETPESVNQRTTMWVTGCYASTDPADVARELPGQHDLSIDHDTEDGSSLLGRFADRLDTWLANPPASIRKETGASSTAVPIPLPVVSPARGAGHHIRAELKIQDGCDAHCTFCIIPKIRKRLRFKRIEDAVLEARRLVDHGHLEIVLTGIFLGAYGHETALRRRQTRQGSEPLADLIHAVASVPGIRRLRLSSLEPGDVTETLLDAMVVSAPVFVPHLHLPLQSGSDPILRRMNRQYRVGEFREMVKMVNSALTTPDGLPPALTTDIIVGFPGETDEDFEHTVQIVDEVEFLHMHLFPFSPRPGTAAARWTSEFLPAPVIEGRLDRLRALESNPADGLSIRCRRRLCGRTTRVVIEGEGGDPALKQAANARLVYGRCDHYALVHVRTDDPAHRRGAMIDVRITEVTPVATFGAPAARVMHLPVLSC